MRKVILILGCLVLVNGLVFCQENVVEKAKIEKVWEVKFDTEVRDFFISPDNENILVNTINGERIILSKEGKIRKKRKGKWGRFLGKREFILNTAGEVEDEKGNILMRIPVGSAESEQKIISPQGNYIAYVPSFGANFDFIEMYETNKGSLLWKYKEELKGEPMIVSFISENYLAAFANGKIIVFDTQTGKVIWEKSLTNKTVFFGDLLSCSDDGQVAVYSMSENTIYSLNKEGNIMWRYVGERTGSPIFQNMFLSPSGEMLIAIGKDITAFNNRTGKILWKIEEYQPKRTWSDSVIFPSDKNYIFISGLLQEAKKEKVMFEKCRIYIVSKDGNILDQIESNFTLATTVPGIIKLMKDGKTLIVKEKAAIYCLKIKKVSTNEH